MSALHSVVRGRRRRDLVLLHGWGMNLRVWDGLAQALERYFRVIAVDLPGHGASDWDERAQTPAAQAWRIHETLAPLTTRYSLLGWSLGGQFALDLAAAMPAGMERLVLVATTPRFLSGPGWRCGTRPASLTRLMLKVQADPQRAVRDFLRLQVRGCTPRTTARVLEQLLGALHRGGAAQPAALAWGLERLREADFRATLAAVRLPTLVIGGQHDAVTPPAAARALAAALPRGEFRRLRGACHAPFLSHPAQFATLVEGFLRA